ncbi:hypothetical protein J2Z76_000234 [Sedimentibacter acidaminivorans]|uniref:DUF1659 domain-containing protein n=1 Tax=Sedimentibacter acidaminivorans TaxID=913099 RepID=A0ABS4G9N0_9FIRM|nr:DUF1659 domain-containing protein [Sedimentibacter acidaminivorans]MBP1924381.1 hypothetical protein [Sedimentibacter acidaminivorans]
MAIIANQSDSKLKLVLDAGLDENNKEITKNKTFANVKTTATNENVYEVATALAGIQSYTLKNIKKYEEYDLVEE